MRDDRLDIGLVGGPVSGPGLRKQEISTTRLGVLLREGHPLAQASAVPVQALGNEHLILLESTPGWSIRRMVEDALDRAGVSPSEVTTVADSTTMLAFVGAGIGVGFVLRTVIRPWNCTWSIPRGAPRRGSEPLRPERQEPASPAGETGS